MAAVPERLKGAALRALGRGWFDEDGRVIVPQEVGMKPGDRLLTVRGSWYGLGFVAKGPIYKEAVKSSGLDVFSS
jgi:hypothetical protein